MISCLSWLPQVASTYRAPSQTHTILYALSCNGMERTRIKLDWCMYTPLPLNLRRQAVVEVVTMGVAIMEEVKKEVPRSVTSVICDSPDHGYRYNAPCHVLPWFDAHCGHSPGVVHQAWSCRGTFGARTDEYIMMAYSKRPEGYMITHITLHNSPVTIADIPDTSTPGVSCYQQRRRASYF